MPGRRNLPSTIKRSSKKAQDTYAKTLEHAEEEYGDGRRAHQTAYAALKHSFEKKGDRWVEKSKRGPSDSRAAKSPARGETGGRTARGVDVRGSTKQDLYERAKKLNVKGRSHMTKQELAEAVGRKQR
ncbi:MAG TPA: ChaB family protein [Acidimicrobiia bacterium]|nr:ChaB family protein [Acidimicrobiia bacterium]